MVRLDLGPPRLLLGLNLEALDLLPRLADLAAGELERAIGVALGGLGAHDALAGLHDGRVELLVAVAAKLVQEAVAALGRGRAGGRGGVAGVGGVEGGVGEARGLRRGGGRRRGVAAEGAEETAALAGLFFDGLREGLLCFFAAGEEWHVGWWWVVDG